MFNYKQATNEKNNIKYHSPSNQFNSAKPISFKSSYSLNIESLG